MRELLFVMISSVSKQNSFFPPSMTVIQMKMNLLQSLKAIYPKRTATDFWNLLKQKIFFCPFFLFDASSSLNPAQPRSGLLKILKVGTCFDKNNDDGFVKLKKNGGQKAEAQHMAAEAFLSHDIQSALRQFDE